jgi:hypothetical protein
MTDEWREWRLISYAEAAYPRRKRPPAQPPPAAELSADGAWASLYAEDGRGVIAAWMRLRLPTRETLAAETRARHERETRRQPPEPLE